MANLSGFSFKETHWVDLLTAKLFLYIATECYQGVAHQNRGRKIGRLGSLKGERLIKQINKEIVHNGNLNKQIFIVIVNLNN